MFGYCSLDAHSMVQRCRAQGALYLTFKRTMVRALAALHTAAA
jgi:hypothetical protein